MFPRLSGCLIFQMRFRSAANAGADKEPQMDFRDSSA